jgi:heme-degrading monooxygenase HmoA
MYARVTTGYVQPGKVDELDQYIRETLVTLYPQQQGFKGALFLADRSANKAIAITLWETEAGMAAGEASAGYYREQLAKMAHLFASPPVREAYEVIIQEVQQGGPGKYARVLTATAQPGKSDEGMQILRDSVLPAIRQQPGFKGGLWLLDRSTGKVIAITLWGTEADLLAGEASGHLQEQLGKVAHVLATQVVREAYEVAVQE